MEITSRLDTDLHEAPSCDTTEHLRSGTQTRQVCQINQLYNPVALKYIDSLYFSVCSC